jgi:two-component sensor histidine kinase
MNATSDKASNIKCKVSLTAVGNSDGASQGIEEAARTGCANAARPEGKRPSGAKAQTLCARCGTAEAVPFQSPVYAASSSDAAAQKLHVESQLRVISELESRDAERTLQLEASAQELERKDGEAAKYLSVISTQRREKEVILREVHHRVKNNLQVVESMLRMKWRTLSDASAQEAFATAILRIHAMAMAHDRIYQMPDLSGVSLTAYVRELVSGAIAVHCQEADQVKLELDVEEVSLAVDAVVPFGLLMNELLSNCLEHGLANMTAGSIHVSVRRAANGVRLVVQDNGTGLPEGFDLAKSTSMGLNLAASWARQLGGTLEFTSSRGCKVQADFTRLAGQVKTECLGVGQGMAAGAKALLPSQYQA